MAQAQSGRSRTRLVRFLTVGVGAAALLFTLSYVFARTGIAPFAASSLAYLIAFIVAYAAQRSWTFEGAQDHRVAFPRYLALQLGCALFSGLVSHASVAFFETSFFVMSLAATVATSAVSYILSSTWVFADRTS
jgi:putative flippase GtrA